VQEKIRNDWFELSINYRHSPLSGEDWPTLRGGLAAGDRLCNAPLTSAADGRPTTLFAAIRGTRHVLLLLTGASNGDSLEQLLRIADEARLAFPNIFSAHVIRKADAPQQSAEASSVPVWLDTEARVHKKLHAAGPTLLWIRPDGYIGYRGQPANGESLSKHLSRFLICQRS